MDDMSFSTMDVNTNSNNISDEVAEITSGMTVKGDLDSTGSINVDGTVNGNVKCNGKLVVKGSIVGIVQQMNSLQTMQRLKEK